MKSLNSSLPKALFLRAITATMLTVTTVTISGIYDAAHADTQCVDHSIQVSAAGQSDARITGTLCLPSGESPETVQLLIPGATYNRIYWNFPNRSYAHYAATHGQATFAVDRLDTGASSQVIPELLTLADDASSMHQVVTALRHGIGGHAFTKVVTIGHSFGSFVAYNEAATYGDVDAVGLTGFSHALQPAFLVALPTISVPTQLDDAPQFQGRPLGEVTVEGPSREKWFYAAEDSDQSVIAEDTRTRDTLSAAELATYLSYELQPNMIHVPVFLAVGSKDAAIGCGTTLLSFCSDTSVLSQSEKSFFMSSASFVPYVLQGSGHDLNLSNEYLTWFSALSTWVARAA